MQRILDQILPPPQVQKAERPDDMLYWSEEKPPFSVLAVMGLQHAGLALMLAIYAVIAAQSIGLDTADAAAFTSSCIFLVGLCSLLMGLRSRLGGGLLMIGVPGPISLGGYIAVTAAYGIGATMGAVLVAGLGTVVLARFIPRLRAVFPPEVIGVVVMMLGMSMIAGGASRSFGLGDTGDLSLPAVAASAVTVAVIVILSIWGSARLRLVAVLFGALAGVAAAVIAGATDPGALDRLATLPPLAMPLFSLDLPAIEFVPAAIATIFLTEMIAVPDHFGSILAMQKMNDARWRRADMPMVARGVTAVGLTNMLGGFFAAMPVGTSTANIGLAHATGITARRVGIAAGLVLMAAAFLPPLAGLIVSTPVPVVGGILIYTAAYMIVSGMDLIMSRMLNNRRTFTIGLSVVAGTAVMVVPQLVEDAPAWSRSIVESALAVGAIAAIILNAFLRIGIRQKAQVRLTAAAGTAEATDFLEYHGRNWGARREVIMRAGLAVGEALEALRQSGTMQGEPLLTASFDEFNLVCSLAYRGQALPLGPQAAPDLEAMLAEDDDAGIDAAMRQVSAVLIARLADRVRAAQKGDTAELRLHFDH